jgi:arylsulfatase A-like enzyme
LREINKPNILVLNVEGLRPEYLGPYGNDWIDTPHFNRLAVTGFVFDHCLAGGINPSKQLTALWSGCYPNQASRKELAISCSKAQWLPDLFRRAGWSTILVSSSEEVIQHPGAVAFDEHRLVAPLKKGDEAASLGNRKVVEDPRDIVPVGQPVEDWSETRTAAFFSHLIEIIEADDSPRLIWCQLATLNSIWESPLEIREKFREPGDPPAWTGINIPRAHFSKSVDPDVYLPFVQAYAAEIHVLDLCLGGLLEAIRHSPSPDSWTIVLLSSYGLPLGEHGYLGYYNGCLHAEVLHIPLIFVFSDGTGQAERSQALVYPHDALATLTDWLGIRVESSQLSSGALQQEECKSGVWISGRSLMPVIRGESPSVRDRVFCLDESKCLAIRTPAWFAQILLSQSAEVPEFGESEENSEGSKTLQRLRILAELDTPESAEDDEQTDEEALSASCIEISELRQLIRLFVKPDDRWEVNEVADRCPDVAVQFLQMAYNFLKTCEVQTGEKDTIEFCALPPLNHDLAKGIDA